MPVKAAKGAKGACDRLWRDIVKAGQRCERCGLTNTRFEAAHIIGRRFAKTRTDERNGWCLCSRCHFLVDNFTDEHQKLVEATIGQAIYDELRETALDTTRKMDWELERERLKHIKAVHQ